jgi:hypothetical protein
VVGVWGQETGVGLEDDTSVVCVDAVEPAYAVPPAGISGRRGGVSLRMMEGMVVGGFSVLGTMLASWLAPSGIGAFVSNSCAPGVGVEMEDTVKWTRKVACQQRYRILNGLCCGRRNALVGKS